MAVFLALTAVSACAQRSKQTAPVTSPSATAASAVETVPSVATPSPTTIRLDEVQLTEAAGQRGLIFRFSRPPEGVDYFPLRNPSRLVVDVKGPIESQTKVQTYKATDAQVTSVRAGSYQGRLRLVIDLKGKVVPQFSVDNQDTLVTAFIGEKDVTKSASTHNRTQVLVASVEEDRGTPGKAAVAQGEKKPASSGQSVATTSGSEKTKSATASTALSEEKLSAQKSLPSPSTSSNVKKPIDVAQAAVETPKKAPSAEKPARPHERGHSREESLPPPASVDRSTNERQSSLTPEGEFRPVEYSGRKISLDFKNADIHDVFRILADVSGLNIVTTDDVKARVTLRLVEVPWDQALDVVLQANGLEKIRVGNVITISTTRRLETERSARLLAENAQRKLSSLETSYVKINYVKATDIVDIITQETEQMTATTAGGAGGTGGTGGQQSSGGKDQRVALLSPRGTIAADKTTNVVIIRDVAKNLIAIRELISRIDVQTPQVVIESYIVTTNENLNRDLGIQWGYNYNAGPRTGNPTGLNFPGTVGFGGDLNVDRDGNVSRLPIVSFPVTSAGNALNLNLGSLAGTQALDVRLSALENQGKVRVVARPRVVTLNNKEAEIKSRRIVRVPVISGRTSIVTGGEGGSGAGGNAFQEFDVGITLKITPQISSDGFVLLDIDAESSELTDPSVVVGGAGNAFPVIPDSLSRTTNSSVLIRASNTFVLGGIYEDDMRQTERGIPYLRDTPGIGWLFRSNTRAKSKRELMVFITPKLVAGSGTAGLPTAQKLWENRSTAGTSAERSAEVTK